MHQVVLQTTVGLARRVQPVSMMTGGKIGRFWMMMAGSSMRDAGFDVLCL
jgi:hypothetical protein